MAFRLSNNVIGALNLVTFLLSVPVLGAGIWLRTRADGTECDHFLWSPAIALGAVLMAVSLVGLVGACCRVTWLLWLYLLAMFTLIVALLCFTAFAFAVTNRGAGEAVSGAGYKEYRLGDYSTWMQRHVGSGKNWARIRSCIADADVCRRLQDKNSTLAEFLSSDLSPVESSCCKPPTSCNFTHAGGTAWTKTASFASANPDCSAWSNDADKLCYGCQSCKAGVVDTLKRDWKRAAIVNVVFLVLIIVVYSIGCCAFRNSRRDNNAYHSGGGWKQGGYA
ncbi:tetraspanin-8-like [Phragmites australis]|uniref:tetraspanin-8-like n=1 Tax=Phragmites australis TaxID=29695 RepID=UPI002D773D38|nr:tetraspanin-8-like [Phragmites australis]